MQTVVFAAAGFTLSRALGGTLRFPALMRLASVAFTPAILVEAILTAARHVPSHVAWLWLVVTGAYFVFAIRACALPTAGRPVAPSAPEGAIDSPDLTH